MPKYPSLNMIIRLVDKEDGGGRGFNEINKRDLGWENTNFQKRNIVQIGLWMKEVLKKAIKLQGRLRNSCSIRACLYMNDKKNYMMELTFSFLFGCTLFDAKEYSNTRRLQNQKNGLMVNQKFNPQEFWPKYVKSKQMITPTEFQPQNIC